MKGIKIKLYRKETQNEMGQPGTKPYQEEKKKLERKDTISRRLFIFNANKM
jgi:hypothetical protein